MNVEVMFWTVLIAVSVAEAAMMGDQCDWTGSGLSSTIGHRAVTPVYLRCREGTVTWMYPRGALRLLFKPPLPAGDKEFSVCIRVVRGDDPPDLFHSYDVDGSLKPERFPARLFVEGPEKLVPLYAPDDGDGRELRCFRSRKGRAALYVEAEPEEGPTRRVAELRYEARPITRRHYDPATADCRPCTDAELELAFCTSDLVSRGMIVESQEHRPMDSTRLTLKVTKLLRATGRGDRPDLVSDSDDDDGGYYRYDVDNSLETTHRNHGRRRDLHAHIHVPSVCGASAGAGEFLVMARRRLGRYSLLCAPRIDDWKHLVEKRNADGTAHCKLHH